MTPATNVRLITGPLRMGLVRRGIIVGIVLALGAFMLSLLIRGPMSPEDQLKNCVINMQIKSDVRILLNCDTTEFMRLGNEPAALLEPGNARQSRPLFVVAAYSVSHLLKPIAALAQTFVPTDTGPNVRNAGKIAAGLQTMLPVYLSYLLFNVIFLIASATLLLSTLPRSLDLSLGNKTLMVLLTIPLFTNDVVKAFVWSPHTQMLNILVPMLAFRVIYAPPGRWASFLIAFAAGLGMLAYANMPILFGALVLARLRVALASSPRDHIARTLVDILVWAALLVLPAVIWGLLVLMMIGSYEVIEASKYHEFVWILEAYDAGIGTLLRTSIQKFLFFFTNALIFAIPSLVLLVYCAVRLAAQSRSTILSWWRQVCPVVLVAASTSVISLGYFFLVGWPAARLAYVAIPPLVALTASSFAWADITLPQGLSTRDRAVVAVTVLAYAAFVVVKDGPWS